MSSGQVSYLIHKVSDRRNAVRGCEPLKMVVSKCDELTGKCIEPHLFRDLSILVNVCRELGSHRLNCPCNAGTCSLCHHLHCLLESI